MDDLELIALERSLAGDATPEERARLAAWLRANPRHREVFQAFKEAQTGIVYSVDGVEIDHLVTLVDHYTAQTTQPEQAVGHPEQGKGSLTIEKPGSKGVGERPGTPRVTPLYTNSRSHSLPQRLGYLLTGAAVVFILMFGYGHLTKPTRAKLPVTTYTTAKAQRANITLPDGSHVTLDVASRLDVPGDYAMGNRTLVLTGEALFTVTKHSDQPLRIVAGKTTAEVLGTRFVVRHYATDTTTNVAVQNGKVSVHHGTMQPVVLAAMQQADVGSTHGARVRAADSSRFSFAAGVLEFKGTPLSEVALELERWYDVEIRLGDPSLATRLVAGGFIAGSRADLAELLAGPLGVRVVQDGRTFTLYRR